MVDSRAEMGKKDELDTSCTRKKMGPGTYQKDTRIALKELHYGQSWNNFKNKIMEYWITTQNTKYIYMSP